MAGDDDSGMRMRIERDIASFYSSVESADTSGAAGKVIEMARMYASDAKSYLEKGDLYTAFSCISYAHGMLDALKEMGD